MSLFQLIRARGAIWRTNGLLSSCRIIKSKRFNKIVTSQLGVNGERVERFMVRRYFRTSALLSSDDQNYNGTDSEDERRDLVSYDHSGDTPSEGDFNTVSSEETSLVEPEFLSIEAFTDVFEQRSPKCPGCGTTFQSDDPGKNGYIIPSKNPTIGEKGPETHLNSLTLVCQKCFNLKHYNKPFPVTVTSGEIMEYLGQIQRRKGLILYVVDVMDLPGSVFPNLLETVGETKRIIIIGNKVDMLPVESNRTAKQEEHLKEILFTTCKAHSLEGANVKSMCLVSAKTGFGITQLASKIMEHWDHKGDIYLIGCSNSGKTTLFNLLLDLFSVHKKADLLQRATVSLWPGTTQRMLRFPIGHWMLQKLCLRMREGVIRKPDNPEIGIDDEIISKEETSYRDKLPRRKLTRRGNPVALVPTQRETSLDILKPSFVMDEPNKNQTWLYDTPGIISQNQITNLLTMEEIRRLNPTLWFVPRTFILKPGHSLLLGGLARVDYHEIKRKKRDSDSEWDTIPKAIESVFFTVVASPNLPVHICSEERADEVYSKHAGTELLRIPVGGKERMETFPPLGSQDFTIKGIGWDTSAADVVLSSVGWVSVTAGVGSLVTVKAHTPNAVGLHLRQPALLPTSVQRRGKRGVKYQGHASSSRFECTRKRNPQFISQVRGRIAGESQWVKEIERRRKEQRFLLRAEKRSKAKDRNLLQRSAVSDPPHIPGAKWLPLPRRKLEEEAEEEEEKQKLIE